MARPTKYNDDRAKEICDRLRAGATRKAAAESVGVEYQTFINWLESNFSFLCLVTRAESECEVNYSAILKKAAGGFDTGTTTRTVKTVFKTRKTKMKDGSVVEEQVPYQVVTEATTSSREFDWRASLEWLKRRRREEWGDNVKTEAQINGSIELVGQAAESLDKKLLPGVVITTAAGVPGKPDESGEGGSAA